MYLLEGSAAAAAADGESSEMTRGAGVLLAGDASAWSVKSANEMTGDDGGDAAAGDDADADAADDDAAVGEEENRCCAACNVLLRWSICCCCCCCQPLS